MLDKVLVLSNRNELTFPLQLYNYSYKGEHYKWVEVWISHIRMSHSQESIHNNTLKCCYGYKNMALEINTIFLPYNFNSRNSCYENQNLI